MVFLYLFLFVVAFCVIIRLNIWIDELEARGVEKHRVEYVPMCMRGSK